MISYTKRNVMVVTLILTIFIYSVISVVWANITPKEKIQKQKEYIDTDWIKGIFNLTEDEQEKVLEDTNEKSTKEDKKWSIQIPKISLTANIAEGTSAKVIAKDVGHFESTSTLNGNVGLAAHNRGIGVESYFKNIKYLEIGDEIIYQKDDNTKKYKVVENAIIDETDWSYLQNTEDNRITLITCVENRPEYRQCIQAIEI